MPVFSDSAYDRMLDRQIHDYCGEEPDEEEDESENEQSPRAKRKTNDYY